MLYITIDELASKIKNIGVSQKKFCQRLNISETHLSRILNGKNQPSFKLYCSICDQVYYLTEILNGK